LVRSGCMLPSHSSFFLYFPIFPFVRSFVRSFSHPTDVTVTVILTIVIFTITAIVIVIDSFVSSMARHNERAWRILIFPSPSRLDSYFQALFVLHNIHVRRDLPRLVCVVSRGFLPFGFLFLSFFFTPQLQLFSWYTFSLCM